MSFRDLYTGIQSALIDGTAEPVASFQAASRQVQGLESEVDIRQFRIQVDEPEDLGGGDQAPNPVEYLLAALASCQEITYRLYADALGIPLKEVSVALEGDLDLRGFFAIDDRVRPGFQKIRARVTLDSPADPASLSKLKAVVDKHCPVLDILANQTPINLGFETVNSGANTKAA